MVCLPIIGRFVRKTFIPGEELNNTTLFIGDYYEFSKFNNPYYYRLLYANDNNRRFVFFK